MNEYHIKIEQYLQNKQVYLTKEIADRDFKTIAAGQMVHSVGNVSLERLSENNLAITININESETTIYQCGSDEQVFDWIKSIFIPVAELLRVCNTQNKTQRVSSPKNKLIGF